MLEFYEAMKNTQQWKTDDVVKILERVIKLEMLEDNSNYLDNLYNSLSEKDLNIYKVNLNDLYIDMPNHLFLIMSFQDQNKKYNYVLIDPEYNKFVKKGKMTSPLYYEAWPSEILQNINPNLLKNLLNDKYSFIDDNNFKDYIRSFINREDDINLEHIISGKYKARRRIAC